MAKRNPAAAAASAAPPKPASPASPGTKAATMAKAPAPSSNVHPQSVIRRFVWWAVGIATTVVILLGIKAEWYKHHNPQSDVLAARQEVNPGSCPEFKGQVTRCGFFTPKDWNWQNVPVMIAQVPSDVPNVVLCYDRMPSQNGYLLFNSDGTKDWLTGPVVSSVKGFSGPPGTYTTVEYWLGESSDNRSCRRPS